MALLDDLAKVERNFYECGISRIKKQLSPTEAQALEKVIDDPDSSPTSLSRILAKNGYNISRQTINRHRNRGQKDIGCVCK